MNVKEIGEIRRRVRRDRSNITKFFGCYVNAQKEIVSEFQKSVATMPENESDEYFGKLKRVLTGGIGRNLLDLPFKTNQVANSAEHKFLMDLRASQLNDEALRMEFYNKVIASVTMDDGYLILLGCETYDVPFKSGDGETQKDASDESYTYILCAICPVKLSKVTLQYDSVEKVFQTGGANNVAAAPEMGFLFPCFDNRSTNIYNVLFYTRSQKENHQALLDALFNISGPMPAAQQKTSFEALLNRSLNEECSLDVMQSVHEQITESISMHKESKVPDPLLISKDQVRDALSGCGISEKGLAKFSVDFDETFGAEALLHPKNIINDRKFQVNTPDVVIQVNPQRTDLVETRMIGGVPYILICADENVEVNGVSIHIADKE